MIAETIKKAIWDCERNGGNPTTVAMTYDTFYQLADECRDVMVYKTQTGPINRIFGLRIELRRNLPEGVTMIIY